MRNTKKSIGILLLAMATWTGALAQSTQPVQPPRVYVPYKELAAFLDPVGKTVMMDRVEFDKLLATAVANEAASNQLELAQFVSADYTAQAGGENLTLTGTLSITSLSDRPVAMPAGFSGVGLTKLLLDKKPAPLGYDRQGRLSLIVTGKGEHTLVLEGSTTIRELARGGVEFSLGLPAAASATLQLAARGDLEIHASVPVDTPVYDKAADRTTAALTFGGSSGLTVTMLGNGRSEDQRAIILGESASAIMVTQFSQVLTCQYNIQVLRRGVREMQFAVPKGWTITDVTCPNMVRWSLDAPAANTAPAQATDDQILTVRLRSAQRGSQAVLIKASAPFSGLTWTSPAVRLLAADHQRGYLLVDAGDDLKFRADHLTSARRENVQDNAEGDQSDSQYAVRRVFESFAAGTLVGGASPAARLYYHWGDNWKIGLDLAALELRSSSEQKQSITISPEGQVTLAGRFVITAIGKDLYDIAIELPGDSGTWRASDWSLQSVLVSGKPTGFEYRTIEPTAGTSARTLKIELANPVHPEGTAEVTVFLRLQGSKIVAPVQSQAASQPQPKMTIPLLKLQSNTITGIASVETTGDLEISQSTGPEPLKVIPAGRMAMLGMDSNVQAAWSYSALPQGPIEVRLTRRTPRVWAQSVGLLTVLPGKLVGDWRITYDISRASQRTIFLLADKSLGANLKIDSAQFRLVAKAIVQPSTTNLALSDQLAGAYDLWQLTFDGEASGSIPITVHYERPIERTADGTRSASGPASAAFGAPLIRPIGAEQYYEVLAIQAGEELFVERVAQPSMPITEMDAIDLPELPAAARRLLWAFRLESPATTKGAATSVKLIANEHGNYAVPAALALSADYTTYVGASGLQRTQVDFRIVNASVQFLGFRLPKDAQLWSVRIGGEVAKPKKSADDQYLLSLPRSRTPIPVVIVYAWNPRPQTEKADFDRLSLGSVTLDGIRVNKSSWTVVPPPGYEVASQKTQMQTGDIDRPRPAYERFMEVPISFSRARAMARRAAPVAMQRDLVREEQGGEAADENAESTPSPDGLTTFSNNASPVQNYTRRPATSQPTAKEAVKAEEGIIKSGKFADGIVAAGRYTLPVELTHAPGGMTARFTTLGEPALELSLAPHSRTTSWGWIGFVLIAAIGLALLRKDSRRGRWGFVILVLAVSTAMAIWIQSTTHFANGAFLGALALTAVYIVIGLVRLLVRVRNSLVTRPKAAAPSPTAAILACVLSVALACSIASAGGAEPDAANPSAAKLIAPTATMPVSCARPVLPSIVPYDNDPTTAMQAPKILVPYAEFVRIWNLANPDKPMDIPFPIAGLTVADVRYSLSITKTPDGARAGITLSASVAAPVNKEKLKGPLTLPMPLSGLAVTEATFNDQAAALQSGPSGLVLTIPADAFGGKPTGELRLQALATPKLVGDSIRRGSLEMILPPLPGGVMTVTGLEDDIILEALQDGKALPWALGKTKTAQGTEWTVPLGISNGLLLKWSPKPAAGAADRTLTAAADHDVYAFHWAILGVTKIQYAFSAGQNDRFGLLLPASAEVRSIDGPNLRDWRVVGDSADGAEKFKVIEVRLHRPATKTFDLAVNWLDKLPPLDKPARLSLPRAADVGRESGSVTLHAAGGMSLKVLDISGGKRASDFVAAAAKPDDAPEMAAPLGRYQWPYRPFAIEIQLSRSAAVSKITLDQLVRISGQQAQSFVAVNLAAEHGLLFGASFALPDGYELLSAVGPDVADWYVQANTSPRRLHVALRGGRTASTVALALSKQDIAGTLASLDVPIVMAIDPDGKPLTDQKGRLAVQMAASLDTQTLSSQDLKPLVPSALRGWLGDDQVRAVQFAYSYETPKAVLKLSSKPQPTKVRVEILNGLAVGTTDALYTYRLRYTIDGSPVDRVSFAMPSEFAPLMAVTCPSLRGVSQTAAGNKTTWTVTLTNEVSGVLDVAVNFALPIDASTTSLPMPRITVDAPGGYRAIVAVQNFSRHELAVQDSAVLTPVPAAEQKTLLPAGILSSLQYVWQAFTDDWSLNLKITAAKQANRVAAIVDLMAVTTTIDRDGQCRYEAKIELQNRSEQFLRIRLPKSIELWSAVVADQPVKPVLPKAGPSDEVLIPLIKTSAGGLPYDVRLYLAGKGAQPLDGITMIQPPAIAIVGMDVQRTTWSLRLPAGYRYETRWAKGNMSPIAGTAEKMAIALDARIEQFQRFSDSYSDVSVNGNQIVSGNLYKLNKSISGEMKHLDDYLETNRRELSEGDYSRLKDKLSRQSGFVADTNAKIGLKQQAEAAQTTQSLNTILNADARNPGTFEQTRNRAINDVPDFYRAANSSNISAIDQELSRVKQTQANGRAQQAKKPQPKGGKSASELTDGKDVAKLDTDGTYRYDTEDQKSDVNSKITQLEQKKSQLSDNRVERMYQGQADVQKKREEIQGGPVAQQQAQGEKTKEYESVAGRGQPQAQGPGPNAGPRSGPGIGFGNTIGVSGANAPATAPANEVGWETPGESMGYVGAGTYSLPVELPAGEVVLDFAHPSGQVTMSLWAIPNSLVRSIRGTVALLAILLVVWALSKTWRRVKHARLAWLIWLAYALAVVVAYMVGGIVALWLVGIGLMVIERIRRPSTSTAA